MAYLFGNTEGQLGDACHFWADKWEAGGLRLSPPPWHIVKGQSLQLCELPQVLLLVHKRHGEVELGELCHDVQARHIVDRIPWEFELKDVIIHNQLSAPANTMSRHINGM